MRIYNGVTKHQDELVASILEEFSRRRRVHYRSGNSRSMQERGHESTDCDFSRACGFLLSDSAATTCCCSAEIYQSTFRPNSNFESTPGCQLGSFPKPKLVTVRPRIEDVLPWSPWRSPWRKTPNEAEEDFERVCPDT